MEKPKQHVELPSFDTIEQLMADSYLLKCISEKIIEFTDIRYKASEGGKIKLKRNAIDFLMDLNQFNEKSIATEYIEIHYKRSKLPGTVRELISFMLHECVGKTFKHYDVLFNKQNKITSKTKKNGN